MKNLFQKAIASLLVFSVVFSFVFPAQSAYGLSFDFEKKAFASIGENLFDLVAIVVDEDLKNDNSIYVGLRGEAPILTETGIYERIERFAEDLSANYPRTNTRIITFNKNTDSVLSLSGALENLYRNERLIGVVLAGDIPLPVVNKNGNRFVSLYPYTDFDDKVYILENKEFVKNPENRFEKSEIWHGVIRAPEQNIRGMEKLAGYFDKNHLYYLGEDEYARFARKLFFADLIDEEKKLNSDAYKFYLRYIESLEDLAFNRFNKHWAFTLNSGTVNELDLDPPTAEGKYLLDALNDNDTYGALPDFQTKQIIEQALTPYYKLFTKYVSQINDWADYTGRYSPSDIDSTVSLISVKDEFTKKYLRLGAETLESKINEVAEKISNKLPILEFSLLGGNRGGVPFSVAKTLSPGVSSQTIFRFNYKNEVLDEYYVNGVPYAEIENPMQCGFFAGSSESSYYDAPNIYNPQGADAKFSILTTVKRVDNFMTASPLPVSGMNTRTISREEALTKFGISIAGDLVEGFSANPLYDSSDKYENPLRDKFQVNDLIVKINGEAVSGSVNFKKAVENAYRDTFNVLAKVNDPNIATVEELSEALGSALFEKITVYPGDDLNDNNAKIIMGNMGLEFYRGGVKMQESFSFSIRKDGLASREDPQGDPEIIVMFSPITEIADFDTDGDGAIFTIYDTRKDQGDPDGLNGFDDAGYDNSAGCNMQSSGEYENRCFYPFALMPARDAGGGKIVAWEDAYADMDEVILDQCYFGLPTLYPLSADGNPYSFVLDPSTRGFLFASEDPRDIYGSFLKAVGDFVRDSSLASFPSKSAQDVWDIAENFSAEDLILNDSGQIITLKNFSDHFGLFDGIDNDGDGLIDEADEANVAYGLDPTNMRHIARKMLAKEGSFTVPGGISGFPFDITLSVSPSVAKEISSVIVHNEPTNETLSAQINSMSAGDLPIDNPRYVAFLDGEDRVSEIIYPNFFEVGNFAELEEAIFSVADDLAALPGSFRIFGETATPSDYTFSQIRDEILQNHLLPVVSGNEDIAYSYGFDAVYVSREKIADAIKWLNLNIDEKHEYVLQKYLNDEEDPFVKKSEWGYEAAYLNFDGNSEYFDMNFNKDLPEETDARFNPFVIEMSEEELLEEEALGLSAGKSEDDDFFDFDFVWLDEFIEELFAFLEAFTVLPEFKDCCGAAEEYKDELFGEEGESVVADAPIRSLDVSVDKNVLYANGADSTLFTVRALGAGGELAALGASSQKVSLKIDGEEGVLILRDSNSKTFTDGKAEFELVAGNPGIVNLSAEIEGGKSPAISVRVTNLNIEINTYTAEIPFVSDSELNALKDAMFGAGDEAGTIEAALSAEQEAALSAELNGKLEEAGISEAQLYDLLGMAEQYGKPFGDLFEEVQTLRALLAGADEYLAFYAAVLAGEEEARFEGLGVAEEALAVLPDEGADVGDFGEGDDLRAELEGVDLAETDEAFDVDARDEDFADADGDDDGALEPSEVEGRKTILVSTPVVETQKILRGEVVKEDEEKKARIMREFKEMKEAEAVAEKELYEDEYSQWQDYYIENEYYEKYLRELSGGESWQNHYIENEYYEKYISRPFGSGNRRYLVQIFSDRTILAYLPDSQNPFIDAEKNPESNYAVSSANAMVADGESLMKVDVLIYDEDGKVDKTSSASVRLSIEGTDIANIVSFENGNQASALSGVATFYLRAGTKTGTFQLRALVTEGAYPVREKEITLLAGPASSVSLSFESEKLVRGASTVAKIKAYDKFGNLANNDYTKFSLFSEGPANFSETRDRDQWISGIQIDTLAGEEEISIKASDEIGDTDAYVALLDFVLEKNIQNFGGFDIEDVKVAKFEGADIITDKAILSVIPSASLNTQVFQSGAGDVFRISAELLDDAGQRINYNGAIVFTVKNDSLGRFTNDSGTRVSVLEKKMNAGFLSEANVRFVSSGISGVADISASVAGFAEKSVNIEIGHKVPQKIELFASEDVIFSDSLSATTIFAKLYDESGNLANTDNSTVISFAPSGGTKDFVQFIGPQSVKAVNGVVSVGLVGTGISGKLNLTASAPGLPVAQISIDIKKRVGAAGVRKIQPRALFVSLLGGSFGNIMNENNIAETFLFSGKTQVVSSLTATGKDYLKLAYISPEGDIEAFSDSLQIRESENLTILTDTFSGSDLLTLRKGVNVELLENFSSDRFALSEAFSGNSTSAPKGYYLIDKENELGGAMKPGSSYLSLNDSAETAGIGFEGANKHLLLFSAGNSVGDSHIPYGSEALIIFGDPMIRVEAPSAGATGFNKTIGKSLYSGSEDVLKIIEADIDGDGDKDLLLLFEEGDVRLLIKENSNAKYRDFGVILHVPTGIYTASAIDLDNNGFDDLIFGTVDSCTVGGASIELYRNFNGRFERETLSLDIEGKAYEMKSADLNLDGCEDLVVSDSAGNIRTFYNGAGCSGLSPEYTDNFNFGVIANSDADISESLFVKYDGMPKPLEGARSLEISVATTQKPAGASDASELAGALAQELSGNENFASLEIPEQRYTATYSLAHIRDDERLKSSTKKAYDLNGGNINQGDEIQYIIEVKNTSSVVLENVILSDLINPNMTLMPDSLVCLDPNCPDAPSFESTGLSLRPYAITGLSVPANGSRKIAYSVTMDEMPIVAFEIGRGFYDYDFKDDPYPDIMVIPQINPDGLLNYIYSLNRVDENNHTVYALYSREPEKRPQSEKTQSGEDFDEEYLRALSQNLNNDEDFDGLPDSWGGSSSKPNNLADDVADAISGFFEMFRCSGAGCFPIPYNYAFFAPDASSFNPGMAVLSLVTVPPYVLGFLPQSANPSSFFRMYVSPTLTGGVGTAVCIGWGVPPYGAAPCFAYALPMEAMGVCPDLGGFIDEVMTKAKTAVSHPDVGLMTVVSDGSDLPEDAFSSSFSYSDPDFPVSVAGDVNIRIPGFPSVITNWLDAQTDEIFNKLLDLPDLYFIYPDISTMFSDSMTRNADYSQISNLHDVLRAINSIPLIQIETKEIVIKIPAISQAEIVKWQRQAYLWLEYEKLELEKIAAYWSCDISEERKTLCDMVTLQLGDLTASVEVLLGQLDFLANLPRDILNWRTIEAKYAMQIICYLDAIMNFTGGYIKKQMRTIESWMKAVEDAIRTFKDWKAILDISIDYQASCDECKTDRFGKLGLLLSLLAVIPDPPVIEFPKWPDIVFDMSQVEAGVRILWPDIKFRPENINLPDLPTITLPTLLPEMIDITITTPGLGLDALMALDLPDWIKNFPIFGLSGILKLPDLPPLPIPKLPDLPRPPKIPTIPNFVMEFGLSLQKIMKILCLLKKGLVPVPENMLAAEIETLTQPSVSATLPFIKHLGMQMPGITYDFFEQIKVNVKINFGVETEFIYYAVKTATDYYNFLVKNFVGYINMYTGFPLQTIVDNMVQYAIDYANRRAAEFISESVSRVEGALSEATSAVEDELSEAASAVESSAQQATSTVSEGVESGVSDLADEITFKINEFSQSLAKYIEENPMESVPEKYHLSASSEYIALDSPILNRSLNDIEKNMLSMDLPDMPQLNKLSEINEVLIAYTKGLNDQIGKLEKVKNYDDFVSLIAKEDDSLRKIASLNDMSFDQSGSVHTEIFDAVKVAANGMSGAGGEMDLSAVANLSAGSPKGFFVSKNGVEENILNYTRELSKKVNVIYVDAEDDGDIDIVFSLGGDVYLKESFDENINPPNGEKLSDAKVGDFEVRPAVDGLSSPSQNSNSAEIKFQKSENALAYEILVKTSFLDADADAVYKYYQFVNPLDDEVSEDLAVALGLSLDDEAVFEMANPERPFISLDLPNGDYFVSVYAIFEGGEKSLSSGFATLSPQICADRDAPLPAVSRTEYTLYLFDRMTIDASGSIDTNGEIAEYYLEPLPYENAGKKITQLPSVIWADPEFPVFDIGPFKFEGDLGTREFVLKVVDEAGNSSSQNFKVNVIAPKIELRDTISRTYEAEGAISPSMANYPFSLMRIRNIERVLDGQLKYAPRVEKVLSAMIGEQEKYYTNPNGEYLINDLSGDDMILVENFEGRIVAEINPNTGNIGKIEEGYFARVVAANPAKNQPTKIEIIDARGDVLASIHLIADANTDVSTFAQSPFEEMAWEALNGVNINDLILEDDLYFVKFSGLNSDYPGGAGLYFAQESRYLMIADSAGNLILLDNRVSLTLKSNDYINDPLIIFVNFLGKPIAEVFISVLNGKANAQIVGPLDVPFGTLRESARDYSVAGGGEGASDEFGLGSGDGYASKRAKDYVFADISDALANVLKRFYGQGIISGEYGEYGIIVRPQDFVKRAEFVDAILKTLCIIPRPAAYLPYSEREAFGGYYDLVFSEEDLPWYYPIIKEADLLGIVEGYQGEIDPATGLHPFRPEQNITRAEASKIILESLNMLGIIDLSSVTYGPPSWYGPYMKLAQNLAPNLLSGTSLSNNFIVTLAEAVYPDKQITKAELIVMVDRVLTAYNCFEIDANKNSMSDFCEELYGISDPDADHDNDGLTNREECLWGLDPRDPDSDGGGMNDGDEIKYGFDPHDASDDLEGLSLMEDLERAESERGERDDDPGDDLDGIGESLEPRALTEGIYIVPAECNTCPCVSTLLHKADIMAGDIFFSVISTYEEDYIFSKSKEITIQ